MNHEQEVDALVTSSAQDSTQLLWAPAGAASGQAAEAEKSTAASGHTLTGPDLPVAEMEVAADEWWALEPDHSSGGVCILIA